MHYTYVLQNIKDGDFYIGFTENLKLRFERHNISSRFMASEMRSIFNWGKTFLKKRLKSYLTG